MMGSAKILTQPPMAEEKKTIKTFLRKSLSIFQKKKEKELKCAPKTEVKKEPITSIITNFEKLTIERQKSEEDSEDEFQKFTYHKVEEGRDERIGSHSSQDSGFSEKDAEEEKAEVTGETDTFDKSADGREGTEKEQIERKKTENEAEAKAEDDLEEKLKELSIDGKEKKKKLHTVVVTRGPMRHGFTYVSSTQPYTVRQDEVYRQVQQVNPQTLTGGQVIVREDFSVIDTVLNTTRPLNTLEPAEEFNLLEEYIQTDTQNQAYQPTSNQIQNTDQTLTLSPGSSSDSYLYIQGYSPEIYGQSTLSPQEILNGSECSPQDIDPALLDPDLSVDDLFEQTKMLIEQSDGSYLRNFLEEFDIDNLEMVPPISQEIPVQENPIEKFEQSRHYNPANSVEEDNSASSFNQTVLEDDYAKDKGYTQILTPPNSVTAHSPYSDNVSFYTPNPADYTLSPPHSSPLNPEYEMPGDIPVFDDLPPFVSEKENEESKEQKKRTSSTSSMTLKQYKDLQKEIASTFSKKECCQTNRKPCKEIFQEYMKKMTVEERRNMCVKVSALDLKTAYGVLHQILVALSKSTEPEERQTALFCLICEQVLAQKPILFAEDFGLCLLKAAALRCRRRPLLTRYLVRCTRAALAAAPGRVPKGECVFKEVDAQGDNLLGACAREGDDCADVLAELVRAPHDQPPLFDVHHSNAEGYSALHVACTEHSARAPRLHAVHVLLEHAGADIWRGDVKGGDTAVHLAVNAAACELRLLMVLFRHVDRKQWRALAHAHNRSQISPLEYARCATKSRSPDKYPQEVLEFLRKCRN